MTDPKYVPAPRPTSTPDEIIDTLERLKRPGNWPRGASLSPAERPPRDHRLHVAVSAEELRALDAEAARTGLSRSDVARLRLRGQSSLCSRCHREAGRKSERNEATPPKEEA